MFENGLNPIPCWCSDYCVFLPLNTRDDHLLSLISDYLLWIRAGSVLTGSEGVYFKGFDA